ncbi:MAG TPA: site-specific integrase [Candidatus Acidoferrales bacterium]|nr:site-specific integrase [Candidatus Acidoferrales bacterium]
MARRRYQKGRVFLRGNANPVWVGRWREDVIGADGKTRRIERSAVLGSKSEIPTQRLALRRLEVLLCKINAPDYRPGRIATLAEFAEKWKEMVLSQHKPSSQKAAQSHLRCHILPQLGTARLDALGKEAQQVFVTRLSRTVCRKTTRNVMDTLSAMLRKAKQWGYVCDYVDFRALEFAEDAVKPEPRFFTAKQVRQIIAAALEPYKTMFLVLVMTGMRAGEMLGLQWDDINFVRGCIHIRRSAWYGQIQTTKSKSSTAPVPLPEPLAAILRVYKERWRPNPHGFLFVTRNNRPPSSNKVVQYGLWPVLDALKIPRCGLHAFRHTHASLLLDAGATPKVVQEQLRHSDPRVTLRIYSHVIGDSQRNAVAKLAELLRPSAPNSESEGQYVQ